MYSVENVKKFLNDCGDTVSELKDEIIVRAEEKSEKGLISGRSIKVATLLLKCLS